MDAVVGMEGNGPSGKDLRPIGKILASKNGVAIDGLMAAMMGIDAEKIDTLRIAHQRGLGEVQPAQMEIQGSWVALKNFRMPLSFVSEGLLGAAINRLIYRPVAKPHFVVRKDLCTKCQICIRHCPAQALSMEEYPQFDKEKCISCYCCLELCSSQAIELKGLLRRLIQRK
jgi:ferredoxin